MRLFITCIVLLGGIGPAAFAADAAREAASLELEHGLEGMQFTGPLGPMGETSPSDDLVTFDAGMFWSRICRKYGFENDSRSVLIRGTP